MINIFKKAVSGILLIAVILSSGLGVFAETAATTATINAASVRIFNEGSEISVILSGTAGEEVSVLMLEPGVDLPDMTTDYSVFYQGLAHANTVTLDENGQYIYKYIAEQAGIYTVRAKGAEISYTSTEVAPTINPDRIYVEAWNSGGQYSHPDLNYMVTLSKAQLDAYGAEVVAKSIKEKLDKQDAGRRTIFLINDLSPKSLCGERIWWDEGVAETKAILGEFFKAFRDIGGDVDFIYSDTEQTFTMYSLTALVSSSNENYDMDKYYSIIGEISSDERYPEFREKLAARGYNFDADGDIPLSNIAYYNKTDYNYIKFNAVCHDYAANYLKQAYYETAKEYFANIKYCDYGMTNTKFWVGHYDIGSGHPNHVAGNTHNAGSHSAPVLYSKQARSAVYNEYFGIPGTEGAETAQKILSGTNGIYDETHRNYSELLGTIVLLRNAAKANEEGTLTPWIATEGIDTESFTDVRYRNEMLLHVALHNPDRLLYFNPNQNKTENATQAEALMTALDEVNGFVAYADRRSLNGDQANVHIPFLISGMYANGRNIWRITPDTATVAEGSFKTSADGEDPTFAGGGVTVTFPGGSIVSPATTSVSDIGFWVETPEGVTPVIEYSEKVDGEAARIDFYDVEYGKSAADLTTAETVDAVASYKNFYGDKLNFIAAKYDANGTLIDIESKECGIYSPNGNAVFLGIGKDVDTEDIKFFLWEDTTIRPLATETID